MANTFCASERVFFLVVQNQEKKMEANETTTKIDKSH